MRSWVLLMLVAVIGMATALPSFHGGRYSFGPSRFSFRSPFFSGGFGRSRSYRGGYRRGYSRFGRFGSGGYGRDYDNYDNYDNYGDYNNYNDGGYGGYGRSYDRYDNYDNDYRGYGSYYN